MGWTLFFSVTVLGVIATLYSFMAKKSGIEETGKILTLRAYGILVLSFGFSLHTLGDTLGAGYGEATELLLESIAHGIILIAFILFFLTTQYAVKNSERYWFK